MTGFECIFVVEYAVVAISRPANTVLRHNKRRCKILCLISHLFDHLDQASHLKFGDFVLAFSRVVLLKFNPRLYKICFTAYLTTQIIKQDQNLTYRCTFGGLRIYNLFNLSSLPILVTFQYA